jgi:hypothetical protein
MAQQSSSTRSPFSSVSGSRIEQADVHGTGPQSRVPAEGSAPPQNRVLPRHRDALPRSLGIWDAPLGLTTKEVTMRIPTLALLLGFGLSGATQARAAEPEGSESTGAVRHFDFEDDQVEGTIQRPDGDLIDSLRKASQPSLIEIRRNFIPEIIKSLEDLE